MPKYLQEITPEPSDDGGIGDAENRAIVSIFLEKLSPRLARTLRNYFLEQKSRSEIIQAEGIQNSTFHKRIEDALRKLRRFDKQDR